MGRLVYVVQNHVRFDAERGELVPRHNIEPARTFGDLRFILSPKASMRNLPEVVERMEQVLSNFTDQDHLLLIGNPVFIGMATSIAAAYNRGRVRFLIWSRKEGCYTSAKTVLPVEHRPL
jgi:hypothetical protein